MTKRMKVEYLSPLSTKGFSMLAEINRPVSPSHVTKIANSINRMGVIRCIVVAELPFIDGTNDKYIIDGQHLYHACLRNGVEIPYVTIDIKDHEDLITTLALLNTSSKAWVTKDYLKAWSAIHTDYVLLNKYFNTYDIEVSQVAEILLDNTCSSKHICAASGVYRTLKKGTFRVGDEKLAVETFNQITDCLKIVPRMDRMSNKLFIATYVTVIRTLRAYNHAEFLDILEANKDKFKLATLDPNAYKKVMMSLFV